MSKLDNLFAPIIPFSAPIGRLFISGMFVMSGLNKIGNYDNTVGWMEAMGVPGAMLPLAIALEVFGGVSNYSWVENKNFCSPSCRLLSCIGYPFPR